jgi:hypothetical protein
MDPSKNANGNENVAVDWVCVTEDEDGDGAGGTLVLAGVVCCLRFLCCDGG